MSANYRPELGEYHTLEPFRFWCQKVLPTIYDDSLSYYELLNKVVGILNGTMADVEVLHTDIGSMYSAYESLENYVNAEFNELVSTYNELESYVNGYFENLDVQDEIDNKLDELANDGTLSRLIQPDISREVSEWLEENITPTTPTIDNTLTVSGAGADSKVTGDYIRTIIQNLISGNKCIEINEAWSAIEQGYVNDTTGAFSGSSSYRRLHSFTYLKKGDMVINDGVARMKGVYFNRPVAGNAEYVLGNSGGFNSYLIAPYDCYLGVYFQNPDGTQPAIEDIVLHLYRKADNQQFYKLDYNMTEGYAVGSNTGKLIESESYSVSDFIPVKPGFKYKITMTFGGNNASLSTGVAGYGSNYTFVSAILGIALIGGIGRTRMHLTEYIVTIPDNVYYIRGSSAVIDDSAGNASDLVVLGDLDAYNYLKEYNSIKNRVMYSNSVVLGTLDTAGEIVTSDSVATTAEALCLPYGDKTKFKIHLNNKDYAVIIRTGISVRALNSEQKYYHDGDIATINQEGANYFRISMVKGLDMTSAELETPLEIMDVSEIGLALEIMNEEPKFLEEQIDKAKSAQFALNSDRIYPVLPMIAHCSDLHGDWLRTKRFYETCEAMDVDLACVTGDFVSYDMRHGIEWFTTATNECNSRVAICVGNHDVISGTDSIMTDADVYDAIFSDIRNKLGSPANATSYYRDFADIKIRMISVNLYGYHATGNRGYTYLTSDDITFICNSLKNTPNDYGVIILSHAIQQRRDNFTPEEYDTFYNKTLDSQGTQNPINGSPLYDIVDAYIGRTTINNTYTNSIDQSTLNVTYDFTNATGEFIAHLSGHTHADYVYYLLNTTEKQLMLSVQCALPLYGRTVYKHLADWSDTGRSSENASGDAFNVYCIDRNNKTIKIIRIGASTTFDMKERDIMVIPYAD